MLEKIRQLAQRYEEIEYSLSQSEVWNDTELSARLTRERRELEPLMEAWRRYERCRSDMQTAEEMLSDPELRVLGREELEEARAGMERAEADLKILLLPKDPDDGKNVIVEIRGGVGGEESALFAADLFRMYSMYAERKGFRVEIANRSETELGGIREISFIVQGENAFSRFRFESGVHRVQRIPVTETQGRIHTSTVTVAVLAEAQEVDFELNPEDLRIDVFRSSGHGGQCVNTTDSAVRVTHIPTGMFVASQQEKSQHRNKEIAMRILRSRLLQIKQDEEDKKNASERRSQVGTGDRSERIRTYNYPQNRVSDHRFDLTFYDLDNIMEGNLDELIGEIRAIDANRRLSAELGIEE